MPNAETLPAKAGFALASHHGTQRHHHDPRGDPCVSIQKSMTLQVATIGKDGCPHVAPMWFVVDDDKVVFRSFTKSQKIVNLQRNPKLTVLIESGVTTRSCAG